jgi:hypothetical protein
MLGRRIALRDGDEAGETRLGREQVVRRFIELAGARVVPDRQQTTAWIVHELEVHRACHLARPTRDGFKPIYDGRRAG